MPNTSGLNAHAKPADFAEHLRARRRPRAYLTRARAFFSSVASASWNDFANDSTPSRSSVAVTSAKSTPAPARSAITCRAASTIFGDRVGAQVVVALREHVDRRLRERVHGVARRSSSST